MRIKLKFDTVGPSALHCSSLPCIKMFCKPQHLVPKLLQAHIEGSAWLIALNEFWGSQFPQKSNKTQVTNTTKIPSCCTTPLVVATYGY